MVDRKRPRTNVSWIVRLFLGLSEFSSIAQKPRLEMYRTVDVVGLLVSGGCFILALGLGHLASGSTSHVGARRGHPAGARSHPRGYNGNVGGDERGPDTGHDGRSSEAAAAARAARCAPALGESPLRSPFPVACALAIICPLWGAANPMQCHECDAVLPPEARFCFSCGARLEPDAPESTVDALLETLKKAIG